MKAITPCLFAAGMGIAAGSVQAEIYSAEAIADLRFLIEEEKLARDVYLSFGTLYPTIMPFQHIPNSENTHYNTLVTQAGLAGVDVSDLTSLPSNTFQNLALQSLFTSLVAQGSTSAYAALTVGKNIELQDIDDLTVAMSRVPSTSSLYNAYNNLRNGSYNHLNAFNNWLAMTPTPPVPEPETYAMFLAGLGLVALAARRHKPFLTIR
ncbi:MAG TPA: DUF2202 domain-containing protein [Thiobacillaceae bacterium]|nr:DUF2202 domain-containing protein [Thiobacillaceae bacterium]